MEFVPYEWDQDQRILRENLSMFASYETVYLNRRNANDVNAKPFEGVCKTSEICIFKRFTNNIATHSKSLIQFYSYCIFMHTAIINHKLIPIDACKCEYKFINVCTVFLFYIFFWNAFNDFQKTKTKIKRETQKLKIHIKMNEKKMYLVIGITNGQGTDCDSFSQFSLSGSFCAIHSLETQEKNYYNNNIKLHREKCAMELVQFKPT